MIDESKELRDEISIAIQQAIDLMIEAEFTYQEADIAFNQCRIEFEMKRRAIEASKETLREWEKRQRPTVVSKR